MVPDARQHVVQRRVVRSRVRDAVGRDVRYAELVREPELREREPRVLGAQVVLDFDIERVREEIAQRRVPFARRRRVAANECLLGVAGGRTRERDEPRSLAVEIAQAQPCLALAAAQLRRRDRAREVRVAVAVLGEQDDARLTIALRGVEGARALGPQFRRIERELDADDRAQRRGARRLREADRAVQPVAVGQRERVEPELECPCHELFGMRRAVEKAEVGPAVELGIPRCHGRSAYIEQVFDVNHA